MLIQLIMNSAKSFFPTRADIPSRNIHRNKLYHIYKERPSESYSYRTLEPQSTSNIFKEGDLNEIDKEIGRPIGGEELFKKMDQLAQEKRAQGKKLRRTSRQYCQRNVYTSISNNNHKIKRISTEVCESTLNDFKLTSKRLNSVEMGEELFKSHQTYKPPGDGDSQRENENMKRGLAKSLQTIQPKFHSLRKMAKIERQVQEHHDKMALLGQMDRERPLVELCGDSYFQMILRNRFEEELKLPSFIYRIKEKLSDNKAISRLKSYKPHLLERRQLVLRGHEKGQVHRE